jgi:hypothetical protein
MAIRRLNCVHTPAEDRQRPSGRSGQAVSGFATFYVPDAGWVKVPPGSLDLAELWGGASGFGNSAAQFAKPSLVIADFAERPMVEFYLDQSTRNRPNRVRGFVAINGDMGEMFTFGFFGKRYS